jgi:hypothetical protein
VWEPPLQRPKQTMYFVEARAYLRQILRLLGIVSVGQLIRSWPDAMRKLLQFGALGL